MAKKVNAKDFSKDHNSGKYSNRELMRKYKITNIFGLYSRRAYCRKIGLIPMAKDTTMVKPSNVSVKMVREFKTITFPNGFVIAVSNTANKKLVINDREIIISN